MLVTLKRWRKFRCLSVLPSPADNSPLFPLHRGKGALASTTHIRSIMQDCFDRSIRILSEQNQPEEAESLMDTTVHWLRHTGISDDVVSLVV